MGTTMRIVMMGTGVYAVPLLSRLYESRYDVVALFTRPERLRNSDGEIIASPMRQRAVREGTPVYAPEDVNASASHQLLREFAPDLLIVCDYGQILKPETLKLATRGGMNLHASLLPKYRGAAPIQWAIFYGEVETGNTVIQMTAGVDAGPVVAQQVVEIEPHENAVDLELRLADLGSQLVVESVGALEQGRLGARDQDLTAMTLAPKLRKQDGKIDWSRPAEAIVNQIRAMVPWPKTFTNYLPQQGRPLRVIVHHASRVTREALSTSSSVFPASVLPTGTVALAEKDQLIIQTGHDLLRVEQLQPSGKRTLSAEDFLRGYRVKAGDCFGQVDEP